MKTKLSLVLALLVAAAVWRSLLAGDGSTESRASTLLPQAAAKSESCACCAVEKPAPAAVATAGKPCCAEEKATGPLTARSLYQLDASFTNDAGAPALLTSLRGRPVVLAMFFASCEYACPLIVDDMKRLGAALPAGAREQAQFVLVSFDIARDTPAALAAYRERMKLDGAWTLLRGDAANVQELAMLLGVKFKQDARGQFSHSNVITILNPEGEIAHQRAGLMGDVSEAAKVVERIAPNALQDVRLLPAR